mmetsp:Transcript_124432/g.248187  ORF Transcript_124432/g.248187 Transcript_124432/m.248187 type:complete len:80 (-) Transcript_124432:647-886(-)
MQLPKRQSTQSKAPRHEKASKEATTAAALAGATASKKNKTMLVCFCVTAYGHHTQRARENVPHLTYTCLEINAVSFTCS